MSSKKSTLFIHVQSNNVCAITQLMLIIDSAHHCVYSECTLNVQSLATYSMIALKFLI